MLRQFLKSWCWWRQKFPSLCVWKFQKGSRREGGKMPCKDLQWNQHQQVKHKPCPEVQKHFITKHKHFLYRLPVECALLQQWTRKLHRSSSFSSQDIQESILARGKSQKLNFSNWFFSHHHTTIRTLINNLHEFKLNKFQVNPYVNPCVCHNQQHSPAHLVLTHSS